MTYDVRRDLLLFCSGFVYGKCHSLYVTRAGRLYAYEEIESPGGNEAYYHSYSDDGKSPFYWVLLHAGSNNASLVEALTSEDKHTREETLKELFGEAVVTAAR